MENTIQNPIEETNSLVLKNASVSTIISESANLEKIFDEAEQMEFKEESREYLSADKLNENQPYYFIYEGLSEITIPDTGEVKPAVLLRAKNGTAFITSAKVITNALSRINAPEVIKLVYVGKRGTGSSKYADFKIFTPVRS